MQVMQRRDAQGAFGRTPSVGLPNVNRVIGEFRVRFLDRDDQVTFTTHQTFVAGARVGARDGYETLRAALRDLAQATSGEASAAAILEHAGRFYGHGLKGRDHEDGSRAPLQPVNLEPDARAEVVELRIGERGRSDVLRALVDGAWSHHFRG